MIASYFCILRKFISYICCAVSTPFFLHTFFFIRTSKFWPRLVLKFLHKIEPQLFLNCSCFHYVNHHRKEKYKHVGNLKSMFPAAGSKLSVLKHSFAQENVVTLSVQGKPAMKRHMCCVL